MKGSLGMCLALTAVLVAGACRANMELFGGQGPEQALQSYARLLVDAVHKQGASGEPKSETWKMVLKAFKKTVLQMEASMPSTGPLRMSEQNKKLLADALADLSSEKYEALLDGTLAKSKIENNIIPLAERYAALKSKKVDVSKTKAIKEALRSIFQALYSRSCIAAGHMFCGGSLDTSDEWNALKSYKAAKAKLLK